MIWKILEHPINLNSFYLWFHYLDGSVNYCAIVLLLPITLFSLILSRLMVLFLLICDLFSPTYRWLSCVSCVLIIEYLKLQFSASIRYAECMGFFKNTVEMMIFKKQLYFLPYFLGKLCHVGDPLRSSCFSITPWFWTASELFDVQLWKRNR